MAQHTVTFQVPDRPVGKKDIVFTIMQDNELFGRLKVSKGAVVWLPGRASKGYRLNWSKLDEAAREYGHRGHYPI